MKERKTEKSHGGSTVKVIAYPQVLTLVGQQKLKVQVQIYNRDLWITEPPTFTLAWSYECPAPGTEAPKPEL